MNKNYKNIKVHFQSKECNLSDGPYISVIDALTLAEEALRAGENWGAARAGYSFSIFHMKDKVEEFEKFLKQLYKASYLENKND